MAFMGCILNIIALLISLENNQIGPQGCESLISVFNGNSKLAYLKWGLLLFLEKMFAILISFSSISSNPTESKSQDVYIAWVGSGRKRHHLRK